VELLVEGGREEPGSGAGCASTRAWLHKGGWEWGEEAARAPNLTLWPDSALIKHVRRALACAAH